MAKRDDVDSKSEPGSFCCTSRDQLVVPGSEEDANDQERRGKLKKCPRKVSSQEFFSISFDVLDEPGYEIVPAVRGHTIRDALCHMLERKGLDFSAVSIYQDSAHSPLPLSCDISKLGGCHLRVKAAKEGVNNAEGASTIKSSLNKEKLEVQRKNTGGARSFKGLLGLSSDDSCGSFGGGESPSGGVQACQDGSWKMGKARSQGKLSGLFSNPFKDKEKMEVLTDILNRFGQHGIPKSPRPIHFDGEKEQDDALRLEESWALIVDDAKQLPARTWQQQSAIWELLTTEVSYLRKLKVIRDLFIDCLCNLQNEKLLNEVDIDKLFGNIQELYHTNLTLWKKCLLPMLNHSRTNKSPFDPTLMRESFIKFDHLFHPYTKFFLEQNSCIQYLKELYQDNEQFKAYLAWCESQKECNRQRLMDLLVKPMERLTKYALLLKVIHKRSDDGEQKKTLLEMIRSVEAFVSGVNSTLRQRHEQERLANIINRIDSYEPVDVKDDEIEKILKPYLEFDLTCPMPGCAPQHSRQLLLEGDLRLKDVSSSKMDVHCFLFTDMLLICKSMAKKGDRVKVIRPPYIIDRLEVHEMKDGSGLVIYLNEYNVATSVYTLHSNEIRIWLEAIRKAQDHFKEVKASRPEVTFDIPEDDDFDFTDVSMPPSKSPKGSGGSSLIHSHSGSVELSEPCICTLNHSRNASLEFSEMRASSASSDEGSTSEVQKTKTLSNEPNTTQPVSPRPERRIFLLKGGSGSSTPNTLSVGYPYSDTCSSKPSELSPTSLTIPSPKSLSSKNRNVTQPPQSPRVLRRSFPVNQSSKPPLVKTKNLVKPENDDSHSIGDEHTCFDFDIPVITGLSSSHSSPDSDSDDGTDKCKEIVNREAPCQRRNFLTDRRYHTADSIEHLKASPKDAHIQKRLSWHYGQRVNCSAPSDRFMLQHSKGADKCPCAEAYGNCTGNGAAPLQTSVPEQGGDVAPVITQAFYSGCVPSSPRVPPSEARLPLNRCTKADYTGPVVIPPVTTEARDELSAVHITISESSSSSAPPKRDLVGTREFIKNGGSFKASDV